MLFTVPYFITMWKLGLIQDFIMQTNIHRWSIVTSSLISEYNSRRWSDPQIKRGMHSISSRSPLWPLPLYGNKDRRYIIIVLSSNFGNCKLPPTIEVYVYAFDMWNDYRCGRITSLNNQSTNQNDEG